ncbi:MAG: hypothetical protein ACKVPJ_09585 [Chitinophagales bacterium]
MRLQTALETGCIIIFSMTILFHLSVLFKLIPHTYVWGGRLMSDKAMYKFESVSILLNIVFLVLILILSGYFQFHFSPKSARIILWAMAGLFLLNTIGNLLSKNKIERIIFTPITFLIALLTFILSMQVE